jgi:hypothetical protein
VFARPPVSTHGCGLRRRCDATTIDELKRAGAALPDTRVLRVLDVFDEIAVSRVEPRTERSQVHTESDTSARLRARSMDDRLVIEVEVQCGGLPTGSAENLFAPFVRGTTRSPGTGLGLSIVARASRTLGDDVDVRNLPVFCLTLDKGEIIIAVLKSKSERCDRAFFMEPLPDDVSVRARISNRMRSTPSAVSRAPSVCRRHAR